jgi:hypothetical protein
MRFLNVKVCFQGETMEELFTNLHGTINAYLSIDLEQIDISENDTVMELAV